MKKSKVVVFTRNNAVVLTNHQYKGLARSDVIVDADLSTVKGVAPHFWKLGPDGIMEMTRDEKVARLRSIAFFGTSNDAIEVLYKKTNKYKWLAYAGIGAAAFSVLYYLWLM